MTAFFAAALHFAFASFHSKVPLSCIIEGSFLNERRIARNIVSCSVWYPSSSDAGLSDTEGSRALSSN
jgi:hypothetical protein